MSEKEIIYNFENIVEDSRTEDRKEYYESLRSVLELLKQQQKEIEKLKQEIKDITSIPNDDIEYDEEGDELWLKKKRKQLNILKH